MNKHFVWITGASSGIGVGFAKYFAKLGYPIILSARRQEKLEDVKKQLPANVPVEIIPLDLESSDQIEQAWQQIEEKNIQVGILINNAGISQRSLVMETSASVIRKMFELNFFAVVNLTQKVAKQMIERGDGHIISVSSLVGKFATPRRAFYSATKHALVAFMDALRAELWQQNIRVTTVCPGYVNTGLAFNALTGDGVPQNQQDDGQKNGLSVDAFVNKTMKKMNKGKDEIYVGGKELAGVYLKRFFPNFFNRLIRQVKVT